MGMYDVKCLIVYVYYNRTVYTIWNMKYYILLSWPVFAKANWKFQWHVCLENIVFTVKKKKSQLSFTGQLPPLYDCLCVT